jgi:hypothetical protein
MNHSKEMVGGTVQSGVDETYSEVQQQLYWEVKY